MSTFGFNIEAPVPVPAPVQVDDANSSTVHAVIPSVASRGEMRLAAKPHEAMVAQPERDAILEARQLTHVSAVDEAYYETFRAMRHVAGEDEAHPSLLSSSVSTYVALRRELLKQSVLEQHEKKESTGKYSKRNRLALGECGGIEDPVSSASPTEPLPSHDGVKGGYASWRRALLGLRLEKRRHAVEDDMIRRLASEAMQRAMAAEQREREREEGLLPSSSSSSSASDKPDPMVWRVKQDFTQNLARSVASAAAAEGANRGGSSSSSPVVTITAVAFTYSAPDAFAVGTDNGLVCLCSAQTGHVWATLRAHSGSAVTNLDWSEGYRETLLASCSADRSTKLWRVTFPTRKAPPSLPAELIPQERMRGRGRQQQQQQQHSSGYGPSGSRSLPPAMSRGNFSSSSSPSSGGPQRSTSIGGGRVKPESKPRQRMTAEERARELESLRVELANDLRRQRILREQARGIVLIGGSAECIRTIYTPWSLTHVKFVPQRPGFLVAAGVEEEEGQGQGGGDDDDVPMPAVARTMNRRRGQANDDDNNSDDGPDGDDDIEEQQGEREQEDDDGLGALESSGAAASASASEGGGRRVPSLRRRSSSTNSGSNNNPLASPLAPGRAGVLGVRAAASLITRGMKGSVKAMKAVGGATMGALEAVPVVGGAMAGTVGITANLVKGATNLTVGLTVGAAVGTLGALGIKRKRKGGNRRGGRRGAGGNRIGHLMVLHASAPPDRSTLLQDLKISGFYSSSSLLSSAGAAALALARGGMGGGAGANKNPVSYVTAMTFDCLPGGQQHQGNNSSSNALGFGNVLFVSDARGRVHAYQVETDPAKYNAGAYGAAGASPLLLKDHCVIWGEGNNIGVDGFNPTNVFSPIGLNNTASAGPQDIFGNNEASGSGVGGSGASTASGGGGGNNNSSSSSAAGAGAGAGAGGEREVPFLVSLAFRQQLTPEPIGSNDISFNHGGLGAGSSSSSASMATMLVGVDSTNHVRALKLSPPFNKPNNNNGGSSTSEDGLGGGEGGAMGSSSSSSSSMAQAAAGGLMLVGGMMMMGGGGGNVSPGFGWAPSAVSEVSAPPFLVYTSTSQQQQQQDFGELPTANHCSIAVSNQNPSLFLGTPMGEVFIVDPYGSYYYQQQHQQQQGSSSSSSPLPPLGLLKGGNPAAIGAGILSSQVVAKLFGLGLHPPLAAIQHVALSRFEDWMVSCDELGGLFSWEKVPLSVATADGFTAEDAGYVCEEEAWPLAASSSGGAAGANTSAGTGGFGSPTSSLLSSAGSLGLRGAGLGLGVGVANGAGAGAAPASADSYSSLGLAGSARVSRLQKALGGGARQRRSASAAAPARKR